VVAHLQSMKSERPAQIDPLSEEDPTAELQSWLRLAHGITAEP
jgi:hypothetical protein